MLGIEVIESLLLATTLMLVVIWSLGKQFFFMIYYRGRISFYGSHLLRTNMASISSSRVEGYFSNICLRIVTTKLLSLL